MCVCVYTYIYIYVIPMCIYILKYIIPPDKFPELFILESRNSSQVNVSWIGSLLVEEQRGLVGALSFSSVLSGIT